MTAGPVFPALLHLFGYEPGNTWPLATLFLVLGIGLSWMWLHFLDQQGVSTPSLIVFALLPHPIYYMICIGTEIPFCLLFTVFFLSYFKADTDRRYQYIWMAALLLLLLTRPNALAVVAFVVIDQLSNSRTGGHLRDPIVLVGLIVMAAVFGTIFQPYFASVFSATSSKPFFGIPADQYVSGIFPSLPDGLNQAISIASLLVAKLLYFFGLRPSYSDVSIVYVLARALPGIPLLAGLGLMLSGGNPRHKRLAIFFLLPILLVGSQDRYSVPVQPLLFLYFAKAVDRLLATRWNGEPILSLSA